MTLDSEARSLVLHQFLALRRSGLSALDALNRLVEGLGDGEERTACRDAALSLSAVAQTETKQDDLVRVLSDRSDDLQRATHLAGSYEAASELKAARRSGVLVFQAMFAGPFIAFAALSVFMNTLGSVWGSTGAAAVEFLMNFLSVMRVIGLPVGIFLALLISRWKRVPVFGASSLEAARALYVAASHADPLQASSAVSLSRVDRALLVTLTKRVAPEQVRGVVLELAQRLEREGRRRVEVHHLLSSLMLTFFGVLTLFLLVLIAYLPIGAMLGGIG
ncbi:MAG: hypothetical protein JNM17_03090 [Archangium sp.]|nr:hypothetical protein [Archangium sp.]